MPKMFKVKVCDQCGKVFVPTSSSQKRCGAVCVKEYLRKRHQTPEYKECDRKRSQTSKRKGCQLEYSRRYRRTPEYKEYQRKRNQALRCTLKHQEYMREYLRLYRQAPEFKEYKRKCRQSRRLWKLMFGVIAAIEKLKEKHRDCIAESCQPASPEVSRPGSGRTRPDVGR